MPLTDIALILGFLVQFGATVWWASKINSAVSTLPQLREDLKQHQDEDREFQLTVAARLGAGNGKTQPW